MEPELRPSFNYAFGKLLRRDESEDAVQDARIKAWLNFARYDRDRPFAPWFRVLLHRVILDRLKASVAMEAPVGPEIMEEMIEEGAGDPRPVDCGLAGNMEQAVKSLPLEHRFLVEQRFYRERRAEDIARRAGISRRVVNKRLAEAVVMLRRMLGVESAEKLMEMFQERSGQLCLELD